MTVKARIQGNAVVVTLPKAFKIEAGTVFEPRIDEHGVVTLIPTKPVPDTIEELFKDWKGKYKMPDDLMAWSSEKTVGEELW
ncbi:type II toxin-antitoxin system PemI/MazE family antitoxin [Latilactobacillus fragifolii]|uniref:type II toxin-antitoxin system PemI/MazE family antitoxin n=1 Tax=Latilactobacillus fragifolii TaxID=2814244 RepID=UPI001ABA7E39|nr:hypothetical protein [Latilactobacillus fragifolii]